MKSTPVLIAIALSSVLPLTAQDAIAHHAIAKDWITHHLVFSNPGTREQAIQNGTYQRWLKIVTDPRYLMQQQERAAMASALSSAESAPDKYDDAEADTPAPPHTGPLPRGLALAAMSPAPNTVIPTTKLPTHRRLKKDWSEGLTATSGTAGASGATSGLGEFPATFTSTLGTTSCTADFAIYNTGLAGSSSQASIIAYNSIYPSCSTNPTVYWALNTGGTIVNSVAFYAQPGQLNQTGTQVYFVQTVSGVANLVLLKWKSGSGTAISAPATPTAVTPANYSSCTIPCMTSAILNGSPNDTYSAPYYDPSSDTVYVGDDGGKLHKFNPVFGGSLAEVTTGGWPASVNPNASLGSPVYYPGAPSAVFVGDYPYNYASNCQPNVTTSNTPCGFLYSVSSAGAVTPSHQLDYNNGIIDSPILDATAGQVYVFVGQDNSASCALPPLSSGGPCAAVYQFPVGFGAGATGTEAQVGAGSQFMMSGAFDNTYFRSANPASPSGHLYVVGGTGALNNTLYQVSINSNVMSTTTVAGPAVAANYTSGYYAAGLQVTEYLNGPNDYIFTSVLAFGNATGCTSSVLVGCVMGFNLNNGFSSGSSATGALSEEGGTSGIVVDYAPGTAGNIYFSTLLNTSCTVPTVTAGCAIQTVQSAP